jgi:hypothetical protein
MQPKTFEEACKARGYDPATVLPDVSKFPEKHQKAMIGYSKLIIITEAINEGKEPDWNDSDEYKWYSWMDMEVDDNNPSGFRFSAAYYVYSTTYSSGGSRLCFRTKKACEFAAKQFLDLWRDMMVIPK